MLSKSHIREQAAQFRSGRERVLDDLHLGQSHVIIMPEAVHNFEDLPFVDGFLLGSFLQLSKQKKKKVIPHYFPLAQIWQER